ncbi:MAG: hypothetical protein N2746_12040 [Deltaproteobacteria bacterium]|nr:hypothetical protein [Deltaproteobacteria bacterium]
MPLVSGCEEKSVLDQDVKMVKDGDKITSCRDGIVCREDSDCFDGRCEQGVCRCKSSYCQKDDDCGENMCCDLIYGRCFECIRDISSLDINQDIFSDGEEDGYLVDIGDEGHDAAFVCKKNLDCPLNIPHCDPNKGVCVECIENSHCKSGMCDPSINKCIYPDAIGEIRDIIEDVEEDIGVDVGIEAVVDVGLDISDPCANHICLCGSICVVNNGVAECVNGCKKDTDCCANTVCKSGKCEKTSCTDDSDCKDISKPHCEVISGICYECTNDLHCQSNYYCDSSFVCKYKVDECYGSCKPNTQWCNPVKKQCEDIPQNWCATCSQLFDPVCILSGLSCGVATKKCTKQCSDDSECFGYTCNILGWCTCP